MRTTIMNRNPKRKKESLCLSRFVSHPKILFGSNFPDVWIEFFRFSLPLLFLGLFRQLENIDISYGCRFFEK